MLPCPFYRNLVLSFHWTGPTLFLGLLCLLIHPLSALALDVPLGAVAPLFSPSNGTLPNDIEGGVAGLLKSIIVIIEGPTGAVFVIGGLMLALVCAIVGGIRHTVRPWALSAISLMVSFGCFVVRVLLAPYQ